MCPTTTLINYYIGKRILHCLLFKFLFYVRPTFWRFTAPPFRLLLLILFLIFFSLAINHQMLNVRLFHIFFHSLRYWTTWYHLVPPVDVMELFLLGPIKAFPTSPRSLVKYHLLSSCLAKYLTQNLFNLATLSRTSWWYVFLHRFLPKHYYPWDMPLYYRALRALYLTCVRFCPGLSFHTVSWYW